jgi:hypothetical protein
MAEGWQTYAKILTQRDFDDLEQFTELLKKIQDARLLRSDFDAVAQLILIEFIIPTYLALLPLYQAIMKGKDFSSPEALAKAREFIVEFTVHGLLSKVPEKTPQADK